MRLSRLCSFRIVRLADAGGAGFVLMWDDSEFDTAAAFDRDPPQLTRLGMPGPGPGPGAPSGTLQLRMAEA